MPSSTRSPRNERPRIFTLKSDVYSRNVVASRPTSTDFLGRPPTSGIPEEKQVTPGKLIEKQRFSLRGRPRSLRTAGRFLGPVSGPFEKLQKRGPKVVGYVGKIAVGVPLLGRKSPPVRVRLAPPNPIKRCANELNVTSTIREIGEGGAVR